MIAADQIVDVRVGIARGIACVGGGVIKRRTHAEYRIVIAREVRARAAKHRVRSRTPIEIVMAGSAIEDVVAVAADEKIGPIAAGQHIVAVVSGENR
jgi:hypothetical protein